MTSRSPRTASRVEPHGSVEQARSLAEVTFCVIDLETTGGAPGSDAITELAAVRVRGGEVDGTWSTFVHPGVAIPARISLFTGITDAMVADAPRPEDVLGSFADFARGAVIVGHNVKFDLGFLARAFDRHGFPPLQAPVLDTVTLARRLLRDEVPDCRLGTLAEWLRLDHRPTHRALTDALATTDLLHLLIERAAGYGVFALDDLLALHRIAGHPFADKLRLTDALPRTPGIYEFLDCDGRVVYVGKATNLRQRVRSYFGNDDRRSIRPILGSLHQIRHREYPNSLLAELAELEVLHERRPRFNRAGALPKRPVWLTLTDEAFPRLLVTARPRPASDALGPFTSTATARRAQEAIETAVPIRRCTARPRADRAIRAEPCTPAQLGLAHCPCATPTPPAEHERVLGATRRALTGDPVPIIRMLHDRLTALATAQRFEEAVSLRDRIAAYAAAHRDRATAEATAGRLDLVIEGTLSSCAAARSAARRPRTPPRSSRRRTCSARPRWPARR
ncbi:MAG: DEDD exonuclease domain-containing protein [Ilumatobacteraceae bacterium]